MYKSTFYKGRYPFCNNMRLQTGYFILIQLYYQERRNNRKQKISQLQEKGILKTNKNNDMMLKTQPAREQEPEVQYVDDWDQYQYQDPTIIQTA